MSTDLTQLYFTKTHEWLMQHNDEVTIGITDHAQELLGDLVFIELPQINTEIQAGSECGVLESVKAAADLYAPVSGTIIAINPAVNHDPSLINHDPYNTGWLIKIKITHPHEIDKLLNHEQYLKIIDSAGITGG